MAVLTVHLFTCFDNEIKEVLYTLVNERRWFQVDPMSSQRWHVTVSDDSYQLMKDMGLVEVL